MNVEQILKNQYRLIKEIGSGAFGKVYMAEDLLDKNKRYAIKRLPKQKIYENEYLKHALNKELEIMKTCICDNSVLFIEDFETTSNHNIVMELCDNDLEFILSRRNRGFSEEELKIVLLQLKNVFEIMDVKNIIHRDLKLKNIMICYRNRNEEGENKYNPRNFVVKLADFGFSKVLDEDITSTKLGTPATMAPEIMMNKNYCKKADIWSLGIIMYQLLFKRLPFNAKNEHELLKLILESNGYVIPEKYTISEVLDDLLSNVLQKNINLRFSWKEFYQHQFFKDNKLDGIRKGIYTFKIQPNPNTLEDEYSNMRKLSDDYLEFNIIRAKSRRTGEFVLIKEILKKKIQSNPIHEKIFYKELNLMKSINSEHFIKFIDFYENSTFYYIVTEYFEGKILENFINSRKCLSENLVEKIVKKLLPAITYIDENDIILEFLSPKSFCFKYFKSEDNFDIKFFDFGLNSIFLDEISRKNYLLLDTEFGNVTNKKSNVVSFGILIYKMLFGETIYKFSLDENPADAMKIKSFKLPKNISKRSIKLIEGTCHQNINRRYDWKAFLDDPFIKQTVKNNSKNKDINSVFSPLLKFEDDKIENLGDMLKEKVEFNIKFYSYLLEKDNLEITNYKNFLKEISIILDLISIEIYLFINLLKSKDGFSNDLELHILFYSNSDNPTLTKKYFYEDNSNKVEYSACNFSKDGIYFNSENPSFELLLKNMNKLEVNLQILIKQYNEKIMNFESIQDINSPNPNISNFGMKNNKNLISNYSNETFSPKSFNLNLNLNSKEDNKNTKNSNLANLENFFLLIIENSLIYYMRNDIKDSIYHMKAAKYILEIIIFTRILRENHKLSKNIENANEINSDVFDKNKFISLLNMTDNDDYINICNELNVKQQDDNFFNNNRNENFFLFTFLGGILNKFEERNIFSINNCTNSNEREYSDSKKSFNKSLLNFISFYNDMTNMIKEDKIKNK